MSILIDSKTRVLVQGITGRIGRVQTGYMLRAGTRIVAGVTPGKGGQSVEGVPVFDTVAEAVREVAGDNDPPAVRETAGQPARLASVLFVPPFAASMNSIWRS